MKTNESASINSAKAVWTRETKYTFSRRKYMQWGKKHDISSERKIKNKNRVSFCALADLTVPRWFCIELVVLCRRAIFGPVWEICDRSLFVSSLFSLLFAFVRVVVCMCLCACVWQEGSVFICGFVLSLPLYRADIFPWQREQKQNMRIMKLDFPVLI